MNLSKENNEYEQLSTDYTERLQELNKSTWESCKKILQDKKNYEKEVPKADIKVFITLLEQSFPQSNFRKFDTLMELIKRNFLLIPIRFLTVKSSNKLEGLTAAARKYYEINEQLINKEKPL